MDLLAPHRHLYTLVPPDRPSSGPTPGHTPGAALDEAHPCGLAAGVGPCKCRARAVPGLGVAWCCRGAGIEWTQSMWHHGANNYMLNKCEKLEVTEESGIYTVHFQGGDKL